MCVTADGAWMVTAFSTRASTGATLATVALHRGEVCSAVEFVFATEGQLDLGLIPNARQYKIQRSLRNTTSTLESSQNCRSRRASRDFRYGRLRRLSDGLDLVLVFVSQCR